LTGRFHSNDTVRSHNANFFGSSGWTTADPRCATAGTDWNKCVEGTATWQAAPAQGQVLLLPTPFAADTTEGCAYEGNTRIVLMGDKMRIWSYETTTDRGAACGTPSQLATGYVEVPVPTLVRVGAVAGATHVELTHGAIGDGLPVGTYAGVQAGPGVQYTREKSMAERDKFSGEGNVYIEGELSGGNRLTVQAANNIIVTGDLVTADDEEDLIGLIAGGSVEIYNPMVVEYESVQSGTTWINPVTKPAERVDGWPKNYVGSPEDMTIEAAMLASNGSFRLQNWKEGGTRGKLVVLGSIAQNFRGLVAWESEDGTRLTGYEKEYTYNEGLNKGQPLLFSPLGGGSWVISWLEKAEPSQAVRR
jgi:hypothetical protein